MNDRPLTWLQVRRAARIAGWASATALGLASQNASATTSPYDATRNGRLLLGPYLETRFRTHNAFCGLSPFVVSHFLQSDTRATEITPTLFEPVTLPGSSNYYPFTGAEVFKIGNTNVERILTNLFETDDRYAVTVELAKQSGTPVDLLSDFAHRSITPEPFGERLYNASCEDSLAAAQSSNVSLGYLDADQKASIKTNKQAS